MSAETVGACVRRWYTLNPSCDCAPCTLVRHREQKMLRTGRRRPDVTAAAWAALDRMLAAGRQPCEIAVTAGIPVSGLRRLIEARTVDRPMPGVGYVRGSRLIAAETQAPAGGRVAALGARRRLQAMARMGWSLRSIAAECGVDAVTLTTIRSGKVSLTDAGNVAAIKAWYRTASKVRRDDRGVAASAEVARWGLPASWDDIDDPRERPKGLGPRRGVS